MKVGILTFHYANNYGALLQTYALCAIVKKLGHEPTIINRVLPHIYGKDFLKYLKYIIEKPIRYYLNKSFHNFRVEYLRPITGVIDNQESLKRAAFDFDALITGSDQVWRMQYTKGFGFNYFLDFVPDHIRKISYATSFGNSSFEGGNQMIEQIKNLLSRFYAISVREDAGVAICKDLFGINAIHTLDPTLLLTVEDYSFFTKGLIKKPEERYLAMYFLDFNNYKHKLSEKISEEINLKKINIANDSEKEFSLKNFDLKLRKYKYNSVNSWLKKIEESEYIVTDSFHGLVFSLLYNKEFVCIANRKRGLERMQSLLKYFSLDDRLVFENHDSMCVLPKERIDYVRVNKILLEGRDKSMNFLTYSLGS